MSFIEAALSRGDRRVSSVIFKAWQKGARFDAWDNYFLFDKWSNAFRESGLEPNFYSNRTRLEEEIFPWDFIDSGISKEELRSEFDKAHLTI